MSAAGVAARHSSESVEHYTPSEIVEAARATLGEIDLDPASSATANGRVGAMWFFDAEANGFVRTWNKQRVFADDDDSPSRVFLNPPGGKCDPNGRALVKVKSGYAYANTGELCTLPSQSSVKAWWFKLAREYVSRRVSEAIFVGFSIEILQQTQVNTPAGLPTPLDFYLCFPSRRVAYVKPDGEVGESPPHASVLVYLGPNADRFRVAFSPLGRVIPWH